MKLAGVDGRLRVGGLLRTNERDESSTDQRLHLKRDIKTRSIAMNCEAKRFIHNSKGGPAGPSSRIESLRAEDPGR